MAEGLFYSGEALLNRVLFLSDFNEVNIFVEDEYKEYEYENIFNRLFSYELKISNIFPMKGKIGVKKAFEQYGVAYEDKPSIYIVDGDFDVIMDKEMIVHENFIYLEKYNIESYYVDKKATMKYMAGKLKKTQKIVASKIDYDGWEDKTYDQLKELFINYIIAQKVFPSEKNVGISPHKFIDSEGYFEHNLITDYVNQLKVRVPNYDTLYSTYKQKFIDKLNGDISRLVCGKYVLASLTQYLRNTTGANFKDEDFKYYLVGEFDIKKLEFLKVRVLNILEKCA